MVFGVVSSLLIGISALAWLLTRHRCGADVSILEWACRIVPLYCIFASFVIWATHSLLVALLVGTALLGGIAASCGWRPLPGKSSFLNVIAGMIGAFLSCATLCFLCASICLPLSMGLKFSSALHEPFVKGPWRGDEPTKEVPFTVEFRTAHAFLAEYDRRIVFKSGKHVNLWPDTGGAGKFALYRLADGSYYLVDGLRFSANRCEYHVDTSCENVDLVKRGFFYRIPERGILAGIGWSDQDNDMMTLSMVDENANDLNGECEYVRVKGRSVGDVLTKRRFLGFVDTHGSFSSSTDDPLP